MISANLCNLFNEEVHQIKLRLRKLIFWDLTCSQNLKFDMNNLISPVTTQFDSFRRFRHDTIKTVCKSREINASNWLLIGLIQIPVVKILNPNSTQSIIGFNHVNPFATQTHKELPKPAIHKTQNTMLPAIPYQQKLHTWDNILAHSAIVDNSRLCDAASNLDNNLFSNSKQEKDIYMNI